jgi:hypothetical protein
VPKNVADFVMDLFVHLEERERRVCGCSMPNTAAEKVPFIPDALVDIFTIR